MTLQDFYDSTTYLHPDITTTYFSNDAKKYFINTVLKRVNASVDGVYEQTSASMSYTDGSYIYALSAVAVGHKLPINLFYNSTNPFEVTSPEKFRQLSSSAINMYAVDGSNMYVRTAFGSGTLSYAFYSTYVAQTSGGSWLNALSSTTDSPLLPERYHYELSEILNARMERKEDRKYDQILEAKIDRFIQRIKRDYPSKAKKPLVSFRHLNDVAYPIYVGKEDPLDQT